MRHQGHGQLDRVVVFRGLLVHGVLGCGGMGTTYLASHPVLRTPLVIKTFDRKGQPDIFAEAHLAARVRSPHVVNVLDAGYEEGIPFIVQQYVDGIDLSELVKAVENARLSPPIGMTTRMIRDAAHGLHAIHQTGVVHRDVKPGNVFLGGDGKCSIGDFGISVDVHDEAGERSLGGTPGFMAPEQWRCHPVDRRTDLYALGCTAHFVATGSLPFNENSWDELRLAHTEMPYRRPSGSNPSEAYFFSVVEHLLRKDPAERYPTAYAAARALELITDSPPDVAASADGGRIGPISLRIERGDIARTSADVMVNAANSSMSMRWGVAAALREIGGTRIENEAVKYSPVAMGNVVWTGAGSLNARWVAHAVAAMEGAICIQRCFLRVLLEAEARGAHTLALPALGTGVGGVPMSQCAELTLNTLRTFASLHPTTLQLVRVVLLDDVSIEQWTEVLGAM